MAQSGVASRRESEQLIQQGRVSVNNKIVTALGTKVDITKDEIRVDGKLISVETRKVYLMLYKPKGFLTTLKDDRGRHIVRDLVKGVPERIFPVGRLDYDSEGLLLMTNDGDFANRMQHPKFEIPKTYMVKVKGQITKDSLQLIKDGERLDDGYFKPLHVSIEKVNPKSSWLELIIHEGRNRVIRRYFDFLGHPVSRLIRVAVGDIHLGELLPGDFRYLERREIKELLALSRV
jgi:23S rRNA pseudouridine2605 synthase